MLYLTRLSIAFLTAYFLGRIIYSYFSTSKEKNNIISKFHSFFLGLGFTSVSFWLYTIAVNGYNSNYHIVELGFVAVIYLCLWLKKRNKTTSLTIINHSENTSTSQKKRSIINYLIAILFGLIAVLCLVRCLRYPDGTWDSLAMWNFRARFLSLGNDEWSLMFLDTFDYSHRDYPLFLSSTIARCFNYAGGIDTVIPLFFSWFFTFISLILVYLYLKKLKNKYYAVLAVCLLSYSPQYIFYGCMQYADIPLALFILISVYEFILWDRENKDLPWLCMLFAGLCFWIKNEGIPWFIGFSLVIIYCLYKKDNNFISSIKKFLKTVTALLPIIISFLFVRYFANSENDLVFGLGERIIQLFLPERYEMIMPFVIGFTKQHFWMLFIPIYLLLGFVDKRYYKYFYLFKLILVMYMIYVFVYLITPHDLLWHLRTSFLRIFAVYLPSIMFLGCLLFDVKRNK